MINPIANLQFINYILAITIVSVLLWFIIILIDIVYDRLINVCKIKHEKENSNNGG